MIHDMRWTSKKIAQRIETVEALVYRRKRPIGPFRYLELPGPMSPPPVGPDADDAGWQEIGPFTHWGKRYTDFVLRREFAVPTDWDADAPVALYLPIGEAGDFSHPEALAYVDGALRRLRPPSPGDPVARRMARRLHWPARTARLERPDRTRHHRPRGRPRPLHEALLCGTRSTSPRDFVAGRVSPRASPNTYTTTPPKKACCSTRSTTPSSWSTCASRSATRSTPASPARWPRQARASPKPANRST